MRPFLMLALAFALSAGVREKSIVVESAEAEYTIDVAGRVDPENIDIRMENLGGAIGRKTGSSGTSTASRS